MIPLSSIPTSPGCYLFKNANGEIIYVGKAKDLHKRVSSYFSKKYHDNKTSLLVNEIKDIDFIVTSTEVEAFILENTLIKKHYPKFNLDLKDAARYAYIRIVSDDYPYLEIDRSRKDGGELYGPFVSGAMRKSIMEVLTRNFKVFSKRVSPRYKKIVDKDSYNQRVSQARRVLKGEVDDLIIDLEKEMELASKRELFEYAINLRNRISALNSLKEKQLVEMSRNVDSHIINYVISGDEVFLLVFSIRKGVLEGKEEFVFSNGQDFLEEFLTRYYDYAPIPQEIILPQSVSSSFSDYLTKKSNRRVSIIVPIKGDKKELLDLVIKNVHASFFAGRERTRALQDALNLPRVPSRMECFDISHLGGTNTVASMVSFKDGMPDKSNYRKFRIRTHDNNDDYASIREVIMRRYSKVKREGLTKPDLIIIDGGKGQLSSAKAVLDDLNLNIPLISLAKRLEEVFTTSSKESIIIPKNNKGLQLLQAIRDEAHRFAVSYQRLLRKKELWGNHETTK